MNLNITRERQTQLLTPEDVVLQNMSKLLDGWSKDLAASYAAVLEQGKKLDEESRAKAQEAQKAYQHEMLDAALDREVEGYLGALRIAAQDKHSHVALPEGVRVASLLAGPALAIDDLLAEIRFTDRDLPDPGEAGGARDAQRSAAGALGQGLMPHPLDLATLLKAGGSDGAWGDRFSELGTKLDAVDARPTPNVQLKMLAGQERLETLRDYVDALGAYSPERLLHAIASPQSLRATEVPALPEQRGAGRMPPAAFNAMMDGLFTRARAR